jgi:glutamate formiminotransferase
VERVECVPNFSDGRDAATAAALRAALDSVPGARLLDWHADRDHNRSVGTVLGHPEAVAEAAFRAVAEALRRIDLNRHQGVHPRIGAADVCPFVPLEPTDMPACVALARAFGERVAADLSLPVYLYGEAARDPARSALPAVRRGGFEGLREAIGTDPARAPDHGPRAVHPTGGALAVGAREFLIAFNVELDSQDLGAARAIAREVRASSGGLPGIRALGLELRETGRVQVSCNVCRPREVGLVRLFEAIETGARARGLALHGSELVGMAPPWALDAAIAERVGLRGFDADRMCLPL